MPSVNSIYCFSEFKPPSRGDPTVGDLVLAISAEPEAVDLASPSKFGYQVEVVLGEVTLAPFPQ